MSRYNQDGCETRGPLDRSYHLWTKCRPFTIHIATMSQNDEYIKHISTIYN
ncbi:hypothetical protein Hanom_Chr14g01309691 [Helianthus anomalus]